MVEGGLDFGFLNSKDESLYKRAGTTQDEVNAYFTNTGANSWETVYTVTTGKTFYITAIIFALDESGTSTLIRSLDLGVSSAVVMRVSIPRVNTVTGGQSRLNETIILNTPMKYTSGTVMQFRTSTASGKGNITLVGWEE